MLRRFESPSQIVQKLSRFVVGQDRPKKALATATYQHFLSLAHRTRHHSEAFPFGKPHVLLIGPTGTGKTYLVESLARIVEAPFCFFSVTNLVEAGYIGDHVESLFMNLLLRTRGDLEKAHRGIIFIDEIDKIRRQGGGGRDVSGEGVQSALLPILDGMPMKIRTRDGSYDFDPSKLLIICAGAFVGLDRIIQKRVGRSRRIGFTGPESNEPTAINLLDLLTSDDLEAFGLIPEFIGRFPTVTTLNVLREDQIADILRSSEGSCLRRQQRLFKAHGIDLELVDDAIRVIARRAVESSINARGIDKELSGVLSDIATRLPDLAAQGVRKVILNAQVLSGASGPILQKCAVADFTRRTEADLLRSDAASLIHSGTLARRESDGELRSRQELSELPGEQNYLPF